MTVKVCIDGTLHDERDASISVFDRGFLYGDSVYEVMRTSGGRPVDLEPHLARLARSAAGIGLPLPPLERVREELARTLAAAGNDESYVRIVVTRGSGEVGLDPMLAVDPCTVIIVRPLRLPSAEMVRDGVAVAVVAVQRTPRRSMDPALKTGNYLNNILGLAEAKRAGAYEALLCDAEGRVTEGSSCNVFAVAGGVVTTPALEIGLLAGITRMRAIDLLRRDGVELREAVLWPDDLHAADEVFITSSIRGVLPVTRVDGAAVGAGAPGPVTRRLIGRYAEHLAATAGL